MVEVLILIGLHCGACAGSAVTSRVGGLCLPPPRRQEPRAVVRTSAEPRVSTSVVGVCEYGTFNVVHLV